MTPGDVRIGADAGGDRLLQLVHFGKGDRRLGFRDRGDQPGILRRQEPLGDDDIKQKRRGERRCGQKQHQGLMIERPDEALAIDFDDIVEPAREERRFDRLMIVRRRAQQAAAHHGGERQRYDGGRDDRDRQGHGEFAKHPADEAGHEQQGNEDRDERHGQGNHGEADFAGAVERGLQRVFAVLDMADDIFDHHDRVVNDEAGPDRQRHQGQIVEAEVAKIHDPEGCDERQRQGRRRR